MIIDALKECKNILTVSKYSNASDKIKDTNQTYSFMTEDVFWEINNTVSLVESIGTMTIGSTFVVGNGDNNKVSLEVKFQNPLSFKMLDYDFTTDTSPVVDVFYTTDNVSWNRFNYYSYSIIDVDSIIDDDLKQVLLKYENKIIKATVVGTSVFYSVYNPVAKTSEVIYSFEYLLLASVLNDAIVSGTSDFIKIDLVYVYDTDKYLYENFFITGLKLVFQELTIGLIPFTLNKLDIHVDVEVEVTKTTPSVFYENLYRPKIFQEFDFLPSITKTFFEMLEHGFVLPTEETVVPNIPSPTITEKTYMYYGISSVPNPVLLNLDLLAKSESKLNSVTIDASAGGYIYIVIPSNVAGIEIFVNGFPVTMEESTTNIGGDNFKIYKSQYEQHGSDITIDLIWS